MAHYARSAAIRAKSELADRSISIFVSPAPINFVERRAVLRVLEQHGRVDFFKAIPGEKSIFVSLMKDSESVARIISHSPIKFTAAAFNYLTKTNSPVGTGTASTAGEASRWMTTFKKDDPSFITDGNETLTEFTAQVWPSPEYRHHASSASALSRPWPEFIDKTKSFISATLKQSLPGSMAAEGLKHWDPDFGKQQSPDSKKVDRLQSRKWVPSRFKSSEAEPSGAQPRGKRNNTDTEGVAQLSQDSGDQLDILLSSRPAQPGD
ncbi:hypothetical protein FDECE_15697 [Fusarium decemcellulare]|nr:hypothetical protein FDECE_15697 [Fusarium decemcellulare]